MSKKDKNLKEETSAPYLKTIEWENYKKIQ